METKYIIFVMRSLLITMNNFFNPPIFGIIDAVSSASYDHSVVHI